MTQPQPPQPIAPALVAAFAPGGTLRASINLGNPILANKDPATGEPVGVSIDLAREFARRLGAGIELVVFEKAAASVDASRTRRPTSASSPSTRRAATGCCSPHRMC